MQTFIDGYTEQGKRQGEAEVLLRQLERKFAPASAKLRQRIQQAEADTLPHWSECILTADSLEAVFH